MMEPPLGQLFQTFDLIGLLCASFGIALCHQITFVHHVHTQNQQDGKQTAAAQKTDLTANQILQLGFDHIGPLI